MYVNKAVAFLERQRLSQQPWFLWVSFLAPHDDRNNTVPGPPPALRHVGRYSGVVLPRPLSFDEADVSDKPVLIRSSPRFTSTDVTNIATEYRRTLESLLAVDEGVKRMVDTLAATGQLGNTVIIFLSDNGLMFGEHRQHGAGAKIFPYEESIKTALVIRHPQFPSPRTSPKLVANVDIAPTIVAIAQATPQRIMDGRSLLPLLANPQAAWRSNLLLFADHPQIGYTIQYTGVRSSSGYVYVEHKNGEKEFYNTAATGLCTPADPYQTTSQHGNACWQQRIGWARWHLGILRTCAGATCWR